MQDGSKLILALGLPWIAGMLMLVRFWPLGQPGRFSAIMGYGYFSGIALTLSLLAGAHYLTGQWNFWLCITALASITAALFWFNRNHLAPFSNSWIIGTAFREIWQQTSYPLKFLVFLFSLLMAWRLTGFLLEVVWRPVFAWDAWSYWSHRARIFFETNGWGTLVPWTSLMQHTDIVYASNYRHPATISLVQTWTALALGRWDESLVNLPWWLAGFSLLLALYGQLLVANVRRVIALIFAYILISLPYYGTHMALGGYADLWLAAVFALGAMSLHSFFSSDNQKQLLLLIFAVLALPFIKHYGILYAMLFLPVFFLKWISLRFLVVVITVGIILVVTIIFSVGIDLNIPRLGRLIVNSEEFILPGNREIQYQPTWPWLAMRLIHESSWHLLWLITPALLFYGVIIARHDRSHQAIAILIFGGLILTFTLYMLVLHERLISGTTFNRQLLTIVPAIVFWGALLVDRYLGTQHYSFTHGNHTTQTRAS